MIAALALAAAVPNQPFACKVSAVHDGDTIRCADGLRVRLQGIDANELDGTCHDNQCAAMTPVAARDHLAHLALGKTVTCTPTGTSYSRVTAWCSLRRLLKKPIDLSCFQVKAGAARIWRRYDPTRRLDRCDKSLDTSTT